jgi:hypothetical protein
VTQNSDVHAGLLPVRHCPRRASLVKAVCDRRTTGHRGNCIADVHAKTGLDKPDPKVAEFAPIGSREGYGQTLQRVSNVPDQRGHTGGQMAQSPGGMHDCSAQLADAELLTAHRENRREDVQRESVRWRWRAYLGLNGVHEGKPQSFLSDRGMCRYPRR